MKIKMLKRTYCCNLGFIDFGKEFPVGGKLTEETANRWVKIGMAKFVPDSKKAYVKPEIVEINDIHVSEEEPSNTEVEEVVVKANEESDAEEVNSDNYSEYSAKELFGMCKDLDIEVEAKMSREYYIEKLTLNI